MSMEIKNELGVVKISDQVIVHLAGIVLQRFSGIVTPKNIGDGIKVLSTDGKTDIEINVVIKYGENIGNVSNDIMKEVKKFVEDKTGSEVGSVNIYIKGVSVDER